MQRRRFIELSGIASLITCLPLSAYADNLLSNQTPRNLLIGKGTPSLFGNGYELLEKAHNAFTDMTRAAAEAGMALKVVSSYRNFAHQKRIWEHKYQRYTKEGLSPEDTIAKIIEYSTIPGTSRHHWGTDLDIIDANQPTTGDLLVPSKFHGNGPFCRFKEWMDKHSEDFGFYLVYTDNVNRKGFKYEPWHYSFAELSVPLLKEHQQLDLQKILKEEKLSGSAYFSESFITTYKAEHVLGINPELL